MGSHCHAPLTNDSVRTGKGQRVSSASPLQSVSVTATTCSSCGNRPVLQCRKEIDEGVTGCGFIINQNQGSRFGHSQAHFRLSGQVDQMICRMAVLFLKFTQQFTVRGWRVEVR
jgi:hypothetical protein